MADLHDFSAKYMLLQQVIGLWVTFIVLLLLVRYKFPHRRIYHIVNVSLAVLSVFQLFAIILVSLLMLF